MKKTLIAAALSMIAVCSFAKTTLDDIKKMPEDKFKAFIEPLPAANAKRIATALHVEAFGTPKRTVSYDEFKSMTTDEFKSFINSATLDQARLFASVAFDLFKSNEQLVPKMANLSVSAYDLRTIQLNALTADVSVFFKASGIKPEDVFTDKTLETYNEFQRNVKKDIVAPIRKYCQKK